MKGHRESTNAVELGEAILRETREELARADGKSALLLAAASVVVGAIVSAVLAGSWDPAALDGCAQWIWWLGSAFGGAGLTAFAYAVFPRTKYRGERPRGLVAYYGDIVSTPNAELWPMLKLTARDEPTRLLDQLRAVAGVVDAKYRRIQLGLWLFGASALLLVVSLVMDTLTGS